MLSDKKIEKVKIKLVKNNFKQFDLAKELNCSESALSLVLKKKKDLPDVEIKILEWLKR